MMNLDEERESENVEDRRGFGRGGVAIGGGIGTLLIAVLALIFGVNPQQLLNGGETADNPGPATQTGRAPARQEDDMTRFVRRVLASTEDVWGDIFKQSGRSYRPPTLVLFSDRTTTACGSGSAAVGPFYCPGDERVYIDLSFYDELQRRFHAPGDFAQAYVIAHEVGHHVQKLVGTSDKVTALEQRASEAQANQLSVRMELQADCYAGVWGHFAQQRGQLQAGDVDEALRAASAIGDDKLQMQAQGYVVPDSFTHGTSEQRTRWFRQGFDTGDMRRCDTFGARSL
jgi:predicted metalloprotease